MNKTEDVCCGEYHNCENPRMPCANRLVAEDTNALNEDASVIEHLQRQIEQLIVDRDTYKQGMAKVIIERDEADLRAGAAERRLAGNSDSFERLLAFRRKMGEEWGAEEGVSFDVVWQQALQAKKNADRLNKLRKMCGYIENGSDGVVVISQDDATKEWIVTFYGNKRGHGSSMASAIDDAVVEEE